MTKLSEGRTPTKETQNAKENEAESLMGVGMRTEETQNAKENEVRKLT